MQRTPSRKTLNPEPQTIGRKPLLTGEGESDGGDDDEPYNRLNRLPIVSIVVPSFGFNQVYIQDPN